MFVFKAFLVHQNILNLIAAQWCAFLKDGVKMRFHGTDITFDNIKSAELPFQYEDTYAANRDATSAASSSSQLSQNPPRLPTYDTQLADDRTLTTYDYDPMEYDPVILVEDSQEALESAQAGQEEWRNVRQRKE